MADVHVASVNADVGSAVHGQLWRAGRPTEDPRPYPFPGLPGQECRGAASTAVLG